MLKTRAAGTTSHNVNADSNSMTAIRDDEVSALCWRCRKHAPPVCAVLCPHCKHHMAHSHATYGTFQIRYYHLNNLI